MYATGDHGAAFAGEQQDFLQAGGGNRLHLLFDLLRVRACARRILLWQLKPQ